MAATFTPPPTYAKIPFEHISLSHHPASSPTVTPIIIIFIDRIEKNNAFTSEMEHSLVQAFDMLDLDDRVKAIVVTGKGRMFCAGADLEIGLNRAPGLRDKDHRDGGGRVSMAIQRCRKPTIAAIQGPAVGIGITMTLPMTIRIAYANAKLGFVFAQRGVVMEAASSFYLPRLIGYSKALYLTTTGSVFPASSSHFGDLFAEILPTPDAVLPRALELASQIAVQTSLISTYLMREMMYRNPNSPEGAHLLDSEIMVQLYDKEDKKEGLKAFLEKRNVNFKGDFKSGLPENVPW